MNRGVQWTFLYVRNPRFKNRLTSQRTSGLAGDVARFLGREHQARGRDRPQARLVSLDKGERGLWCSVIAGQGAWRTLPVRPLGLRCVREGTPGFRLPRLAAAHRAGRQLAVDGDCVPAIDAAEHPFRMVAGGGGKWNLVAVGSCGRPFAGYVHPDPLVRQRVNLTTKMPILPSWPLNNPPHQAPV